MLVGTAVTLGLVLSQCRYANSGHCIYTQRAVHVGFMWPQLSRSWCSLVSLHQTLEAVSPSNMHVSPSGQSMSASCAIQCKSVFSLTSVYLQPSKSHSLCIHTVLDPLLVRTHHASGTCSCLCASAEAAPTVPQCRFHVPFLCSCNGSSVIQSLTPTTIFKKLSTCKLLC